MACSILSTTRSSVNVVRLACRPLVVPRKEDGGRNRRMSRVRWGWYVRPSLPPGACRVKMAEVAASITSGGLTIVIYEHSMSSDHKMRRYMCEQMDTCRMPLAIVYR